MANTYALIGSDFMGLGPQLDGKACQFLAKNFPPKSPNIMQVGETGFGEENFFSKNSTRGTRGARAKWDGVVPLPGPLLKFLRLGFSDGAGWRVNNSG